MSGFDQATRATERNTRRVQDAAQESFSQFGRGLSDAYDNVRGFQLKTVEMLRSHANASFDLAERLLAAKSPDQVLGAWKDFADCQADTISKHSNELAGMAENAVKENLQDINERR